VERPARPADVESFIFLSGIDLPLGESSSGYRAPSGTLGRSPEGNSELSSRFVVVREIEEKQQGRDQVVQLPELERFIRAGIDEGTIARKGSSDFLFCSVGTELGVHA
jgi:hypothetical protein